jgi:hypothetical protein
MLPRRSLRASFVVTVGVASTASAALTGCGTAVTPRTCDAGICDDGCPENAAPLGSPCATPGLSCVYNVNPRGDECGPRPHTWSCQDGRWSAPPNTCNPPAPAPQCPPSPPVRGSSCTVTLVCDYPPPPSCPLIQVQARCDNGRWDVPQFSCNPPPPYDGGAPEAGVRDTQDAGDGG